jgi:hypothetical protein
MPFIHLTTLISNAHLIEVRAAHASVLACRSECRLRALHHFQSVRPGISARALGHAEWEHVFRVQAPPAFCPAGAEI